jgi:pheromone shutdown protein TraB
LLATALYLLAVYRMTGDPFSYGYVPDPLLELSFALREMVGWLLVSCGLFGLHALLSGARPLPSGLALAGASLASISAVSSLGCSCTGGWRRA